MAYHLTKFIVHDIFIPLLTNQFVIFWTLVLLILPAVVMSPSNMEALKLGSIMIIVFFMFSYVLFKTFTKREKKDDYLLSITSIIALFQVILIFQVIVQQTNLFSESVYFSGNTGTTWSDGWSGTSRYTFGGSPLATFSGPDMNQAVGMIQLDTGVVSIFNPDIVSSFNTGVATGGTITSGLTFSTSDCNIVLRDRDTSTGVEINTILKPEEYTKSFNSSLLDAKERGKTCDGQVSITKICFYDEYGQLTATGGLDEAIVKRTQDFISVQSTVTLDGGIQDPVYLTDGRQTWSPGIS
jgi:hypothetical protein